MPWEPPDLLGPESTPHPCPVRMEMSGHVPPPWSSDKPTQILCLAALHIGWGRWGLWVGQHLLAELGHQIRLLGGAGDLGPQGLEPRAPSGKEST